MASPSLLTLHAPSHRKLVGRLLLIVALSFAFGFAPVPLYDVFCRLTGLNGKSVGVGGVASNAALVSRIDTQRIVTVEFTATVMPGLSWEVEPVTTRLDLHPGELHQARYRVRNLSNMPLVGQAVPSLSPGLASLNFEKIECFCFTHQPLAPGETKELPLTFVVKPEIDRDIHTITLSYAFFNIAPTQLDGTNRGTP